MSICKVNNAQDSALDICSQVELDLENIRTHRDQMVESSLVFGKHLQEILKTSGDEIFMNVLHELEISREKSLEYIKLYSAFIKNTET